MSRIRPTLKEATEIALVQPNATPVINRLRRMGNSVQLSTAFFGDFHADWERFGPQIIEFVRTHYPLAYFQAAVKLSHVVKVDMNINQEKPKTTNDLLDRMEQQLGARGRELLTKFIESLDKLEREEQASDNAQ